MNLSQANQILGLFEPGKWVCTSDMYRLYMADPRAGVSATSKSVATPWNPAGASNTPTTKAGARSGGLQEAPQAPPQPMYRSKRPHKALSQS
jgi:hypothetical protein